ncbi:MAG: hypothetical protein HY080_02075 [Gammaproteobacteria bacterium]|nr:hypothetical protein [Gammaproteobacteria bacterium]
MAGAYLSFELKTTVVRGGMNIHQPFYVIAITGNLRFLCLLTAMHSMISIRM